MAQPLIPFEHTASLFVLEHGCGCILEITPAGDVSVAVSRAEILVVTGGSEVNFSEQGIAFTPDGAMYFSEGEEEVLMRRTVSGALGIVATEADIIQALTARQANISPTVDMDSITVGSDGNVYIIDQDGQAVIRFDPETEEVSVLVTSAGLSAALQGGDARDLEKGIVAGSDGLIYAFNQAGPAAVYAICSDGTTQLIARDGLIRDPDKFTTRAPNRDIIISDDSGSDPRILRMTPEGDVSVFLSNVQLGAAAGTAVNRLDGGVAFDDAGSFYLAERDGGSILRFDQDGNGGIWVTRARMVAATGIDPALRGAIAFAPQYKLYFAQFGDGLGVLASEIILVSLDEEDATTADVILKGQDGGPLSVDLNGVQVGGLLEDVVIPAGGKVVLETDGEGDLVVGSVTVCSNRPLAGVIVFSGTVGLAGVQSSQALVDFVAPIKALGNKIRTGLAVMNLEEVEVRLTLELVGEDGELVATAEIFLDAMGQLSAFVDETDKFPWSTAVDFSNFEGALRAWADGWVAATVVQTRPDQFATQPVAPNDFRIPVQELLLPFRNTGDLIALDGGCGCVLRFTKEGDVSIEISRAEILAVTNRQVVALDNEGLAFDTQGSMYFIESTSESILKRPRGGQLFELTTEGSVLDALGPPATETDLDGMAFGSDGFLYVTDDRDENEAVLKIDPLTGFVTVVARAEDFLPLLPGGSSVDVEKGIVAGPDRDIWVFSDGTPEALFRICANGEIALVRSGFPFDDPDQFATRAPSGDVLIVDDGAAGGARILQISFAGEIETFLTTSQLQAAIGATPEGEGGIAFDSKGDFFYAVPVFGVFRFDQEKSASTFVPVSAIRSLTGVTPVFGGIAFEPEYKLYFAQFGDGLGVLASEIILVSLDEENTTTADVILKGQDGGPLSVDLNGVQVNGLLEDVVIPAGGKVILETDGEGDLLVGSVTVCSNRPLAGVIVFSGTVGLAGVQSSQALAHFAAPIKALGNAIRTGLAVMNLEEVEVRLTLELVGEEGELVATAEIFLDAMGQLSAFVDETEKFPWSAAVDFSNFEGTLRAWADGWVGATVVQTRPDQFATQPVAGLKDKEILR